MAHKIKSRLANRAHRLALKVRRGPYDFTEVGLGRGVAIGYRRNKTGSGTWVSRLADGKGGAITARLATADDYDTADGERVLDFVQACERARALARGDAGGPTTWAKALDDYEADLVARGGDIANAKRVRHHLTPQLAGKLVASLTPIELTRWRDGLLEKDLTRGAVLRTMKAASASLNHAADLDPRIQNRSAWKTAFGGLTDTYEPVSRIISDDDVLRLVAGSYALDPSFGLFVDVLASTGTRSSQACGLRVADLQENGAARLMMPSSRKGRGRKISRKPVPITASLAAKLAIAANGRAPDAPLLMRADGRAWVSEQGPKPGVLFAEVARRCGLTASLYSLRHSSITRALIRAVPVRVVASLHDTSTLMIEKTYSAYILDHADVVARKGLLDTAEPSSSNVVAIAGRR
jgi:integrase